MQTTRTQDAIALVESSTAHNYHPLPVVVAEAEGAWVTTSRAAATSTSSPRTPR